MFSKYASSIYGIGEAIHGSEQERKVLEFIESVIPSGKRLPISTKKWEFSSNVVIGGKEVKATVMPYSKGSAKGRIGREIASFRFPDHPFKVKDLYNVAKENGAEAVIFYEEGRTRRIGVPGDIPVISLPFKPQGDIEIDVKSSLTDITSFIYEVSFEGEEDEYVVVSAHYDHWLSGFHDNIFSVSTLLSIQPKAGKRGVKLVFFPSEEGPRCCTGSFQYDVRKVSSAVVLDSLYPMRVVFSSPPEMWDLAMSSSIKVKRIEMPTPFSDGWTFLSKGVPSVTLYNDDMIPVYHSDADLPLPEDDMYFSMVSKELNRIISILVQKDVKVESRFLPDYVNLTSQLG
ncbi:hypothetical protein IC006_0245 [Sulfuracidifex tepidarius]|uniref:Peptidase M28 domain-containing protein n=1 Tax=Sulfuracidifex tepidarius TaxID=1294262 RepID=A0A510DS01_9CREN|nr:M28 family peptidase [Sulfuracidifex tepidarius]BBG22961.1 hypothetical protein IC006_0245 [Sulfuracidifex tepidarius]